MKIILNQQEVDCFPGETILEVCNRQGIEIPTLCYLKNLFPSGACRMCVVEIEGQKNLVTSCSYPVSDKMVVQTHSQRVLKARQTLVELVLSQHPDDCLYCERSGNCELQQLAKKLQIKNRPYKLAPIKKKLDISSPSIIKDSSKCILCGRCVRVCEEIQSVSAIDFVHRGSHTEVAPALKKGLNLSGCVSCGQCIVNCPTAALSEQSSLEEVILKLKDPNTIVTVQHAPSIAVTIGEYFSLENSIDLSKTLNTGLRRVGFAKVFDTAFSADLTVMEEASEFVERLNHNGPFPLFTSCSPAWVKYVETFYPEFIDNLSTCKSPQQMLGAIIKSYYAEKKGIDPQKIYNVSIMPCTAKKFERTRPEMLHDIDAVLTTRELAKLFELFNIDLRTLDPSRPDSPLGDYSSAGKIFGATGGVMEAAVRTALHLVTGEDLNSLELKEVRDLAGIKETTISLDGQKLHIAVVSGLGNAKYLLEEIKAGRKFFHFIEVMSCPGGCIAGGGQPLGVTQEKIEQRMKKLYQIDRKATLRAAHHNPAIQQLYAEYLGKPLGHKSHQLLHTYYHHRSYCY